MKFREFALPSGALALLGRNAENNDELVKKFKGKKNVILHTSSPGSPFCVIGIENPSKEDLNISGIVCAKYSQDWRDNKRDVTLDVFNGKNVSKGIFMKKGMWKVRKSKKMKIKKSEILKFERNMGK